MTVTTFDRRFDALTPTGKLIVENAGDWLAVAESIEALGGASDANAVDYTGDTPSNYTPVAATAEGHLEGIDDALASVGASFNGCRLDMVGGSGQDFNDNTNDLTVIWENEVFDTNGYADLVTDATLLTIPAGVSYVNIHANILCDDQPANDPSKYFAKLWYDDGVTPVWISSDYAYIPVAASNNLGSPRALMVMALGYPVSEGDTFYCTVWTQDGTNTNTINPGLSTNISLQVVG